MHRKSIRILFSLFLFACPLFRASTFFGAELPIEAEIKLAEQPRNYFIIDIQEQKISLRARGIMLREWEIEQVRLMGDPMPKHPVLLIRKASCPPPKQVNIKPQGSQMEGEFQLETLEIKDMPTTYSLVFERGISLYVQPRQKGLFSILNRALFALKWHTVLPLRMLSSSCRKNPCTAIHIVFKDQEEAQALFWAFLEGTGCIITGGQGIDPAPAR